MKLVFSDLFYFYFAEIKLGPKFHKFWLTRRYWDKVSDRLKAEAEVIRQEAKEETRRLFSEVWEDIQKNGSILDKIEKRDPWVGGTLVVPLEFK